MLEPLTLEAAESVPPPETMLQLMVKLTSPLLPSIFKSPLRVLCPPLATLVGLALAIMPVISFGHENPQPCEQALKVSTKKGSNAIQNRFIRTSKTLNANIMRVKGF